MHFYPFVDAYCMFFIYAFIGWVVEVVYYGLDEGRFINRGFLNGPLCPVYGIGFYGVILLLERLSNNFFLLFFGSMIICTFVEFWAGFILYRIFKLRWWDYRDEKYNFMGFICPKFSLYWGIACSLGIFVLHPTVLWILGNTHDNLQIVLLVIATTIMVCDIIVTVTAIFGVKRRLGPLTSVSGEMKVISDKIGGSIYGRVDTVLTKSQNYPAWRELYDKHRQEEKELARRHRAEEKALYGNMIPIVRTPAETKAAIASKGSALIKTLTAPERHVLRNVYLNVGEHGKTVFDNITRVLPFSKKTSDLDRKPEEIEEIAEIGEAVEENKKSAKNKAEK
ncbi:MAG: putative ABC transporter permease [Clostridiales bacterium]|nr:putative ABC transporter permease [Clostridiales bacterium]